MVRDFILSYFEEKTSYEDRSDIGQQVGSSLISYLNLVFQIYKYLIILFTKIKKNHKISLAAYEELDDVILKGILDYTNTYSLTKMYSDLEYIKLKYGIIEAIDPEKIKIGGAAVVQIIAGVTALTLIFKQLKDWIKDVKRNKKIASITPKIFEAIMIPNLRRIYYSIKSGKIKNVNELKTNFFMMIKEIHGYYPEVGEVVSTWTPS